ncbi:MAG TPA: hypothetical protein VGP72_15965 [Planctomycetota bacterium]|jgi:hypothetical protein
MKAFTVALILVAGSLMSAAVAADATPDLLALIQAEWRQEDSVNGPIDFAAATAKHIEKTRLLLNDLRSGKSADFLSEEGKQLDELAAAAGKGTDEKLYLGVRDLKRRIALANPLFPSGPLLFCKRVPTSYSHLVMQYFGWRARPGGGIFVLEQPGYSLACRDILGGKLSGGNTIEPRLSFDAKRVVFSWVDCAGRPPAGVPQQVNEAGPDVGYYHVYEATLDGSSLRQVTSGPYEDLMPCYLPDGGIVFCSTRRKGYSRCFGGQFGNRWHSYTLHRIGAGAGEVQALSFNDVSEWFPAVGNDGLIYYARWDYIDRDAVTHQNLWSVRPDGTNPIAVWGNAEPAPHCMFQVQPIPGTAKFVFTASAHHSITAGSIAVLDPSRGVNGHAAITRITPDVKFPESEHCSAPKNSFLREYYASPWPLSEKYFLVSYSPQPLLQEPAANAPGALGIYLLDAFGNRELLYRDPTIGSESPMPIAARSLPPVVPSQLPKAPPPYGEVVMTDVYQGLPDAPRGSIKELRIVQIFPKTTPVANEPKIGLAGEENARAILGTVPVESDGSARFHLPARKAVLFQALDKDGFAYQTMRSLTYVQPGEKISCGGCHEQALSVVQSKEMLASRKPASEIKPGPLGGQPFSYSRFVQPVWDRACVKCHGGQIENKDDPALLALTPNQKSQAANLDLSGALDAKEKGLSRSYAALMKAKDLVPRYAQRNQVQMTPPGGKNAALGSRLIKLTRDGHYECKLTDVEMRALAAWIDCNAIFYGVYQPEEQARQFKGEAVAMPDVQ